MLKVRDILKAGNDNILSISSRRSVFSALEMMRKNDIKTLAVTERGCVVGIFSERDYARKKILNRRSLKKTSVRKLMSTPLFSISPDKSVEECAILMIETSNSHLPVFEDNKLIGIVSAVDVEQSRE